MLTRRQMIATTTTFAGYAVAVDKVLAQAIKTDTDGIVAGDQVVKIGTYEMPVYEARPASGKDTPIVLVISEIWGVHEYIRDCTRRFAKAGYCAVAPELFKREGGVAQIPNVQDILKIVLAQKREQTLGDLKAAADWAKTRPNVKAASVGVTGWCWGGSTVYQVASTNHDIKGAVAWYGPPARPYQGASGPVTGLAEGGRALGLVGPSQGRLPDSAKRPWSTEARISAVLRPAPIHIGRTGRLFAIPITRRGVPRSDHVRPGSRETPSHPGQRSRTPREKSVLGSRE